MEILDHKHIDLIIMDVMIPNMDGYTLTKQLRDADYILPILMITAKVAQEDKKHGFRLGVDDYMTKPADEEEMLLRIAALLRRSKISAERKLAMGQTELLYDSMSVVHNGQSMELPQKEFLLLYKLFS
ncbi:response regulator transcription factor [uncultured Dysosmobacter sp.]|uniref:response regulator transcription factor n=1 Tax=uncultured Dysosmobacter sp. TaxID=2591384 RepID=UPI00261DD27B|nr:response regulator transcription factor [uncultured Dysosmobacter sp.]